MRVLSLSLIVVMLGLFVTPAKADVLVEPYAGYEFGTANFSYGSTSSYNGQSFQNTENGFDLGLRLGYEMPFIFVALDGMYTSGRVSGASGTPAVMIPDSNLTRTAVFIDAGLHILFLRGYVGYGFVDNTAIAASNPDISFTGNALKFGFSFTGIPFIDLNIEYIMHTMTNYSRSGDNSSVSASNFYSAAKNNTAMVSVSVPFLF